MLDIFTFILACMATIYILAAILLGVVAFFRWLFGNPLP